MLLESPPYFRQPTLAKVSNVNSKNVYLARVYELDVESQHQLNVSQKIKVSSYPTHISFLSFLPHEKEIT